MASRAEAINTPGATMELSERNLNGENGRRAARAFRAPNGALLHWGALGNDAQGRGGWNR